MAFAPPPLPHPCVQLTNHRDQPSAGPYRSRISTAAPPATSPQKRSLRHLRYLLHLLHPPRASPIGSACPSAQSLLAFRPHEGEDGREWKRNARQRGAWRFVHGLTLLRRSLLLRRFYLSLHSYFLSSFHLITTRLTA